MRKLWPIYLLTPAFVTIGELATLGPLVTMILTPSAIQCFHFLPFPCGRLSTPIRVVLRCPVAATRIQQFVLTRRALFWPLPCRHSDITVPDMLARDRGTFGRYLYLRSVAAIVTTVAPLVMFLIFQHHLSAASRIGT